MAPAPLPLRKFSSLSSTVLVRENQVDSVHRFVSSFLTPAISRARVDCAARRRPACITEAQLFFLYCQSAVEDVRIGLTGLIVSLLVEAR